MIDFNGLSGYNGDPNGRCHICKDTKPIKYCPLCEHWFCADCRKKWWDRGLGFIREHFLGMSIPGCCGV